jgi:hypothetical protein
MRRCPRIRLALIERTQGKQEGVAAVATPWAASRGTLQQDRDGYTKDIERQLP